MDITEVIAHQHEEQRRSFAVLEEFPREDLGGLAALWERLAILLETHAEAEERFFYPHLLALGTGAADAESAAEEVQDAVKDHNELRDAIRRVSDHDVGTEEWWRAVVDANVANSDHMGEEERQDLADFRQQADLALRHDIAVQFLRFQALHAASGIEPTDKDPEGYVEQSAEGGEGAASGSDASLTGSEEG